MERSAVNRRARATAAWVASAVLAMLLALLQCVAAAQVPVADRAGGHELRTVAASGGGGRQSVAFDGVVEAVRQTAIASQVSGAVVALEVRAGDRVRSGQVLLRLDSRAAEQAAAASAAQVGAASAEREAATRDFERQQQIFAKNYISRAALDRAEAQYRAAQAGTAAQVAMAGAARTQSSFYVVRAPYGGIVADVAVVLGDMALPGRPLLTVYDPGALRVRAAVPQTVALQLATDMRPQAEIPGLGQRIAPARWQLLPTVDPATHTLELRLDLPAVAPGVTPGMFARAGLPLPGGAAGSRVYVPQGAVLRRAQLDAVYVVGPDDRPLLRQVRLGRADADRIEILSGLDAGERVALDPQVAARVR
jgi:RND family efflux transporter MFP subunit